MPLTVIRPLSLWQELDLLCRLGLGLAPVAPDVCAALRQLGQADAAALFWLDENGLPEGFFHEDSPSSVRDLFLNEFERLFVGPHEINVFALAQQDGPRVGRLLVPDARYFRSHTYNLLVRASGHHHALDMRVEVPGRDGMVVRAVVLLFRERRGDGGGIPFGTTQVEVLERAGAHLARAFAPQSTTAWDANIDGPVGHVLLDAASQHPVLADATALQLLQHAQLRGLGLNHPANATALPPDLAHLLAARPGHPALIPVPEGMLHVHAHVLLPPAGGPPQRLLTLQLQRPRRIDVARRVLALPLSPLQREIALLAGLGHPRAECAAHTGVGHEALKKHLRTVLRAAGASDWDSLAAVLRS